MPGAEIAQKNSLLHTLDTIELLPKNRTGVLVCPSGGPLMSVRKKAAVFRLTLKSFLDI